VFGILVGNGVGDEATKDLSGSIAAEPNCCSVSLLVFGVPLGSVEGKC